MIICGSTFRSHYLLAWVAAAVKTGLRLTESVPERVQDRYSVTASDGQAAARRILARSASRTGSDVSSATVGVAPPGTMYRAFGLRRSAADPGHPARVVARDYKLRLREFFARQAERGGASDPQQLADQLLIVFDGAIVQAVMNTAASPAAASAAAEALLSAHGVR